MNLTGGQFKGIRLEIPPNTRPTLSKVRQSVFNMLCQFDFQNKTFLDMFSGSGIMGLEALSRGYKVLALEINSKNLQIIKKNYEKVKIKPNLILKNALSYKTDSKFEIIYLDPPWSLDYTPIIKKASTLLDNKGIIVVEHDNERQIDTQDIIKKNNLNLEIIKQKKYGRSLIDILSFRTEKELNIL